MTIQLEQTKGQTFGRGTIASATWLRFAPDVSFEEWREVGKKLGRVSNASLWWLADWLFFGQWEYGKKYAEAIDATGLSAQTLMNYGTVAGKYQISRRREILSFAHHAELAGLTQDEADEWLDRAEQERWTLHELREARRGEPKQVDSASTRLALTPKAEQRARWNEAAEQDGYEPEIWLAWLADERADHVLGSHALAA